MHRRLRAVLYRLMPWYDPAAKRRRERMTRQVVAEANAVIASRPNGIERIRNGYRAAGSRLPRP